MPTQSCPQSWRGFRVGNLGNTCSLIHSLTCRRQIMLTAFKRPTVLTSLLPTSLRPTWARMARGRKMKTGRRRTSSEKNSAVATVTATADGCQHLGLYYRPWKQHSAKLHPLVSTETDASSQRYSSILYNPNTTVGISLQTQSRSLTSYVSRRWSWIYICWVIFLPNNQDIGKILQWGPNCAPAERSGGGS